MHEAFLIVAIVLFVLGGFGPFFYRQGPGWAAPSVISIGLAFFAASFLDAVTVR